MALLSDLLDLSGIGRGRLCLRWVSSAEGKLFADYVSQVTEAIAGLGKFQAQDFRRPLAALRITLQTPRVRWLMGMEKELVEHHNVYGQKLDPERYQKLLGDAVEHEYHKALVLATLTETEGRQVRQLAEKTGLDLRTVSTCLVELENTHQVETAGYDGQHPTFIRKAG